MKSFMSRRAEGSRVKVKEESKIKKRKQHEAVAQPLTHFILPLSLKSLNIFTKSSWRSSFSSKFTFSLTGSRMSVSCKGKRESNTATFTVAA